MAVLLTNLATALLASSITDSATEVALASGKGALFPSPTGGDWFPLVVVDGTDVEIMKCTGRSSDTLTVVRAQEGTAATAFDAGARADLRPTAAALEAFLSASSDPQYTTVEIGHASDTTIARDSAGVISVEGNVVAYLGTTQTFTGDKTFSGTVTLPATIAFTSQGSIVKAGNHALTLTTSGATNVTFPTTGALATLAGTETLTNKTLTDPAITGAILEDIHTITEGAGFQIDPGNGSIQLVTLAADRTPGAMNFANGESVTLMIDDGADRSITWTVVDVTWVGGSAPTLASSGYTVIVLWKVAGTIYGTHVGDVA